MNESIESLREFLDASPTVYHVQANVMNTLKEAGYTQLHEWEDWTLDPGGKYYLTRGGTSVIAFRVPTGKPKGFLISASHADRPTFKVKENPELTGPYTRLNVEPYGGMIMTSWLDRPLSVAGRVMVETENGVESRLVNIDRDLMLMPNVAIHMNRQVNDGRKWNPAVDTIPLMGSKDGKGKFDALLEEAAGGKVLGHDLFLYVRMPSRLWGLDAEYLSAPALDDLTCAWGCTQGFLKAGESGSIPVLCVFDSEEIGSSSVQGAASTFLADNLRRMCNAMGIDYRQTLAQSFLVSADNGHAMHPNHPELADPANAPLMGEGLVLKFNANLRYCTDGLSAAIFRKVCAKAGVKLQTYTNRADIPGGSTLGRISLNQVSIPTVDMGLPQLAMHSCFETAAAKDVLDLVEAMTTYYGSTLEVSGQGYLLR